MTEPVSQREADGLWLYAVARELDPASVRGLRGVADAAVRIVPTEPTGAGRSLLAVAGPVSLTEFGEEALRRNLEDLDWLAATARAHDAVVSAVSERAGAAVPLRLATVCYDETRVRELLDAHRVEFTTTLDLLTGRTEWGVKVYANSAELAAAAAPTGERSSGAGTDYLRRRKASLSAREEGERLAAEHGERLHARLAESAIAHRRHPPQDSRLSGERAGMALNGAYLVEDAASTRFADLVRELDAEYDGIRVELTGPWPPYSFAGAGLSERS